MLRIHTTIGLVDYYFASEPLDYDNKYWEPRIVDSFSLIRYFQMNEGTGNRIRTMNIELGNHDGYFDTLQTDYGLLNQKFTLYYDDGSNVTKKFVGRVNKIDSYGSTIRLTLREIGYEYLDTPFPDAQIAYDYYSENGINESWNAIPIHFGYVYRYPLAWVNLALSQFMVGSGPIYKISKVYFDKEIVYDEAGGINGYKPTNDSRNIKVRIYRGTGSSGSPETVDGIPTDWPGFSYVEFYYEDDGTPAVPLLADGSTAQVYADIQGIQNSVDSAPERNPAQIIYNILTKPTTEYEGYGLGINSGDVDFSAAITECATQQFYIDGTINQKQNFGIWLDELLRSCRGMLYEEDGKIKLTIDSARGSVAAAFDETGETGYNCFVEPWTEPELEAQVNRMKLSYDLEAETGKFRKKPAVNEESPLGDTSLINSTHATRIGKWNTSEIEFRLISDDHTAHKLAQYYFKKGILQLKTVKLTVENGIPATLDAGHLITITAAKYGWSAKTFLIEQIEKAEEHTIIDAREYDSSVYTYTPIIPASSPEQNPYSAYIKPDKPEISSLSLHNDILSDGTTQTRLNFQFVKPVNNVMQIAVFYKLNTEPESSFKAIGSTIDENLDIIWQGLNSGNYNFRAVSISPAGLMSDLTIDAGDKHYYGQPGAETYLTITADQVAPGVPIISSIAPTMGGVVIYLNVTGGIPDDFSHFKIYRKIGAGAEVLIEDRWTTQLFTDNERDYTYSARSYSAVAVDKTGNSSAQSYYSSAVNPLQVGNDDITTTEQIVAKDFRTALNAGNGVVSGILFNSAGFQAWNGATNTFCIDATTGNVCMTGTITAAAGNIGGWCVSGYGLSKSVSGGYICLYSCENSMFTHRTDPNFGEWHGQIWNGGGWTGRYGLAVTRGAGNYVFRTDTDVDGNNACTQIAGWDFSNMALWKNSGNASSTNPASQGYSGIGIRAVDDGGTGVGFVYNTDHPTRSWGDLSITIGKRLVYPGVTWYEQEGIMIARYATGILFQVSEPFGGGELTASIAGWNFNAACLYSNNILINAAGSIQTCDFVTGNKGWKIDCVGNAEFNNICARGAIRTAVFIKDQISVIGGCAMIRPADVLQQDMLTATYQAYLMTEPTQFPPGSIVRVKGDTTDFWGCVYYCLSGCNYIWLQHLAGDVGQTLTKGQTFVNYGPANSGGIMLNGQCPYIDLYTHAGDPWNGTNSRVRIGNLNGWGTDFCAGDYGWVAGCPTGQRAYYTPRTGFCVVGNISSCSGDIGGWCVSGYGLSKSVSGGYICLYSCENSMFTHRTDPNFGEWHGQIYNAGWTGRYGFAVTRGAGVYIFRADTDVNGANACSQIAGWNFNAACLYSGNLIINSAGAIQGNYTAGSAGWCISCSGSAEFNNVTVRGTVCASAGCIGCWNLVSGMLVYVGCTGTSSIYQCSCLDASCYSSWSPSMFELRSNPGGGNPYCIYMQSDIGFVLYKCHYCTTTRHSAVTEYGIVTTGIFCSLYQYNHSGYYGAMSWYRLQLGNNGSNAIVGGRTSTGGWLDFYVNNTTNTECGTAPDGILAMSICSNGLLRTCYGIYATLSTNAICGAGNCRSVVGFAQYYCGVVGCALCLYGVYGCAGACFGVYGFAGVGYAVGGNSAYYNASSCSIKVPLGDIQVLPKLRNLLIEAWQYKDNTNGMRQYFVGPYAEHFNEEFCFSSDDSGLPTLDGFALKGVQELDTCVTSLKECNSMLESCIGSLESCISSFESRLAKIEERLAN